MHSTSRTTVDTAQRSLRVVFAGGATGGHLFPGIAIAQQFTADAAGSKVMYIGAGRPLERQLLPPTGFICRWIRIEGLKGRGLWRQLAVSLRLPLALVRCAAILVYFRPHLVVGLGGYSSGPVVMAAWLLRIPSVLCEQNVLPGVTNRLLTRFARRIFVSFENTGGGLPPDKVVITGNPVRREFESIPAWSPAPAGSEPSFSVLIVGGSQGAAAINLAMMEALPHLERPERFFFIHQTGPEQEAEVASAYRRAGVKADVRAFFYNIADCYRRTDLVICRAGATTVAEITCAGRGAIFIPYPHAADDHQVFNAQAVAAEGGAEMILQRELTGEILAQRMTHLANNPETLSAMAEASRTLGRCRAAEIIARHCYDLLNGISE
jgi:UDP-N-acetylglucosamine--N-acetylmuramyl-(pentapeptide) pyrophosphoryl-undecaprenol N-acetylglucosamine transferase